MSKHLSIDEFRDMINRGETSDPLVFLDSLMNGQDPRGLSKVYELALNIEEFSDGEPSDFEWEELFSEIKKACKYSIVSLSESSAAAKTVAEYVHAKRKSIENIDGNAIAPVSTLTKAEIRAFLKAFNDEF